MIIEEMEKRYEKIWDKKAINLLKQMKADILMPLNVKDKTIGLLVLGPKETGDMYNDEDIQILEIAGAQAAIAIENAWLFEETKKFNVKLKQEVDRATADLKQANTKLKRLDVAKSEFISIASHQLRTPLTVIKGYISMILEGSFGKISKTQKESLEKVYESSERLIQLIENLLNISRIESGRLQYSFMPLDLEKLVANVVEELESVAKKKGLRFTYKKPKTALPTLKLDEEKLRQVIMNLIDNSIKYTKQGSVTVSLYQKDNRVIFSVKDTGIGIDEEGKDNLFKKFSRGTGTSLIHTEGTGLGLYVAKQIVEGHGGDIWVESPGEGKGSEFLVSLPVAKEGK
jgi:signal transduction histidine kinase